MTPFTVCYELLWIPAKNIAAANALSNLLSHSFCFGCHATVLHQAFVSNHRLYLAP